MNTKRTWLSMVSIREQLISIGGYERKSVNTMETLALNGTNNWIQQSVPFSVWGHCAVTLEDSIIVTGGLDENKIALDSTWIYNVITKDWTEGPKLIMKRAHHACLVDEETSTIHVMGGRGDTSTEKWTFG